MAIGAATIWRVRPGGSVNNGAGFDATISGAGTDYSQQDSPQTSGTAGTSSNTTTFVDAGASFTSQMIGNALRIVSGASFTVGYYFVTGVTNSTTITIDRAPGTGIGTGVWNLGGAAGGATYNPLSIADDNRNNGDKAVAGNIIYIKGSGAAPSVPDYAFANTFLNPQVAGNSTAGAIRFAVDPSQPTWRPWISNSVGDLFIANSNLGAVFDGLIFSPTSAANGRMFDVALNWMFRNCTFNINDIDTNATQNCQGTMFLNSEFFSKTSGTPTVHSSSAAISTGTLIAPFISGCYFHDLGVVPVICGRAVVLSSSVFTNNVVPCVVMNGSPGNSNNSLIRGNTFNGKTSGGDDGIQITTGEMLAGLTMLDNIFSNFATAAKTAVNVTGTAATNDRIKVMIDYNDYYNNTANVAGITLGANDLTLDPQYTSSSDLTLNGTNLVAQAYPRGPICGG